MAIGFPAHAVGSHRFEGPAEEIVLAVYDALELLRWTIKHQEGGRFIVSTGMGWRSYGEKVTVQVLDDGTVGIRSACSWPLQVFDWGKNQDNVNQLMERIDRVLSS